MPGIYGSVNFVVGKPTGPKPVSSGPCTVCGKEVYRQTYTPGQGWCWRHYSCDPVKGIIERRRNRAGNAYGYVPREYGGGTAFDPELGSAIIRSRGES